MSKYFVWKRFFVIVMLFFSVIAPIGYNARGEIYGDMGQYADNLQAALEQGDINDSFIYSVEEYASLFSGVVNVVVTDKRGDIAYAYSESFTGQTDRIEVLVSPYRYEFDSMPTGVAVMVNETGEILRPFGVVFTEASIGENNPYYPTYFPQIDQTLYERGSWYYDKLGGLTGDLWYYLEKEYKVSHRERLIIVDYVNWEREMLMIANDCRLIYRPISQKDLNLFVFYSP